MTLLIRAAGRFSHGSAPALSAASFPTPAPVLPPSSGNKPARSASADKDIWDSLCAHALNVATRERALADAVGEAVLAFDEFHAALTALLARKLADRLLPPSQLAELIRAVGRDDPSLVDSGVQDLQAILTRDPAADSALTAFLYYKGYHALQTHRVAHWLWRNRRRELARFLQNRASEVFGTDIHPAVPIGQGVFIDHATGVVIGETAVIGHNVSILQGVTLGGTGKESGDRHPKIRNGVLLSAGAKVLGNIEIGANAKVGAGSVVLKDVPPCATVAGVPARIVGWGRDSTVPGLSMDQSLPEPDYLI